MNYYKIRTGSLAEGIGSEYPQIQEMEPGQNPLDPNTIYELSSLSFGFPENLNLPTLVLHPNANLTDILSTSMLRLYGFLINKKVKDILSTLKLPSHRYYNFKVRDYNGQEHEYFWLHLISDLSQYVDYRKSEFVIRKSTEIIRNIEINSVEDFENKKPQLKPRETICSRNLVLKKEFKDLQLDIFKYYRSCNIHWNISERLKEAIEKNNITGLEIWQVDDVKIED